MRSWEVEGCGTGTGTGSVVRVGGRVQDGTVRARIVVVGGGVGVDVDIVGELR